MMIPPTKMKSSNKFKIFITVLLLATGYFSLAILSIHAAVTASKTPVNRLTSGLVGYWTFDGKDISGTSATDRSGNANTGTLTNGPTRVVGKVGQGLKFDGVDDRVIVTNNASLQPTTFSISYWLKPKVTSDTYSLVNKHSPTTGTKQGFWSGISANNIYFQIGDGTTWTCSSLGTAISADNRWRHLVGTYTSNQMRLYLDGNLVTSNLATCTFSPSVLGLYLGENSFSENQPYGGSLDDVRIYNRALTASEIKQLYNLGNTPVKQNTSPTVLGKPINSGLVGYWTFDGKDISGTSATDRSGNANTGTLTNGPTRAIGRIGQGLKFDGGDDYVNVIHAGNLNLTSGMTMAAWVKHTGSFGSGLGEFQAIIAKGDTAYRLSLCGTASTECPENQAVSSFMLGLSTGGGCTADLSSGVVPANGRWYHVVGTYDQVTQRIYVDGLEKATRACTAAISTNTQAIGIGENTEATGRLWPGSIDDVRIYNRALSASEVKQLYNLGNTPVKQNTSPTVLGKPINSGLVGYWTFDGKDISGTSATDRSGNANTGTLTNGPTRVVGKIGQGLKFDGVNDVVSISGTSGASFDVGQSKTIAFWIKTSSTAAQYPISKYTGAGNNGWMFTLNNDGCQGTANKITFYAPTNSGETCTQIQVVSSTNVNDQRWHHVLGVFDKNASANGDRKIYVDGSLEASNSAPAALITNAVNVYIANFSNLGSANYFPGSIDDVRIYSRALTASEVKQLYNLGR